MAQTVYRCHDQRAWEKWGEEPLGRACQVCLLGGGFVFVFLLASLTLGLLLCMSDLNCVI